MRLRKVLLAAVSMACATNMALASGVVPVHRKTVVRKVPVKHLAMHRSPSGVSLVMDQVRVVTFNRPISTVFIGNPTIADATVIDPYHAFLLGKTFGVTNLIALGPQSQTVANQQVTVVNRSGGVVTLNKGPNQFSYACTTSHCETNPLPGDQRSFVDETQGTVSTHQESALKAASAGEQH